jgi:hypothetical protein
MQLDGHVAAERLNIDLERRDAGLCHDLRYDFNVLRGQYDIYRSL